MTAGRLSDMLQLTPAESRVLGVLIEKALTTPDQYPLSLNALVAGCNQKNNRDPVLSMTDDESFEALESLRGKQLVVRVDVANSRVHRYKQTAVETLRARTGEVAVLAELLLRGPQTLGELRGRASRMHPLDSLDAIKDVLRALTERPEPFVRQIAPVPGSRAERFVQLLCPDLHPPDVSAPASSPSMSPSTPGATPTGRAQASPELSERVERLEGEVASLRQMVTRLAEALGEPTQ
ncbi:MAG: YceH family protein [Planctomycetota bacterium]|nr:YceH family protein [Planctomycetota bacterium]